jgi:RimJ/RimL family protein N-acetyltransferase
VSVTELETDRLFLRQWQDTDLAIFSKLNSDPEVMAYFPSVLSREESDALSHNFKALIAQRGWGFWAVELKRVKAFIGFVGLHEPKAALPFSPCVEIGWRLHRDHWGKGYATQAAAEVLRYAFEILELNEIVSFTTVSNIRSRSVMERMGMTNTGRNFNHPDIPVSDPLSEHVLYKISKSQWLSKRFRQ